MDDWVIDGIDYSFNGECENAECDYCYECEYDDDEDVVVVVVYLFFY